MDLLWLAPLQHVFVSEVRVALNLQQWQANHAWSLLASQLKRCFWSLRQVQAEVEAEAKNEASITENLLSMHGTLDTIHVLLPKAQEHTNIDMHYVRFALLHQAVKLSEV